LKHKLTYIGESAAIADPFFSRIGVRKLAIAVGAEKVGDLGPGVPLGIWWVVGVYRLDGGEPGVVGEGAFSIGKI